MSHAHECLLDHTGKFLLVPTQGRKIGYERVWVLHQRQRTGKLTRVHHIEDARTYDEPRRDLTPGPKQRAYLVNEKGNGMRYFYGDVQRASLRPIR